MFRFFRDIFDSLKSNQNLYVAFDSGGKRKPTVVLLHGIAATSKTWDPLLEKLDTKSSRVITLDLLGFGQSPRPKDCKYNVNDHATYIHNTLTRLKVKKPYKIVGHSMGAIISAYYCNLYPNEIKELFLLSLPLYIKDDDLHTNLSRVHKDIYLNAYNFLLQNKKFTIINSQRLRKLLNVADGIDVTEENWDSFKLSLSNTIIKQNTYNDIKNVKVPIHIIYGSFDEFLVQESIDKLKAFDNVKITKINAVNHLLGSRYVDLVAKKITGQDK